MAGTLSKAPQRKRSAQKQPSAAVRRHAGAMEAKPTHISGWRLRLGWYAISVLALLSLGFFLLAYWTALPHFPKPTINYVDPFIVSASSTGHVRIKIFGTGFQDGARVAFSRFPALKSYVVMPTEIIAVVDATVFQPGWYDILVRNYDRQYVVFRSGIGVRGSDGKIPEQYYAIHSGSDGIAFATTGKTQKQENAAPSYDNYPNISMGSYTVSSANMDPSVQTFADRYDYLFGTFPTGAIHAINAKIQNYPYADMTEYNNGLPQAGRDGHTDTKITSYVNSYNTSHDPDIQAEDFYLHAKCDCDMLYGTSGHCQTYSASDPQCTQTAGCPYSFITGTKTQYKGWNPDSPGNPNTGCLASTATSRAESRMMSAYLPQWDVPNYAHPQLADYFANTFQNENIYWAGGTSAISGVTFDTVVKDNHIAFADGMHMSWEYWGADVRSATTPAQPFYDYFTLQQNVRTKLSANAGQSAFRYPGNVITIPNEYPLSIYTLDTLASVQDNIVEIFFNHYKNAGNTYQGECGQWKSLIDETKNKGEKFFLNSYELVDPYCSGGTTYDCRTSRGKIESLAMYYLLQNNLTSYLYSADVAPFTPDAFWNPAVTVDIGQPTTMPSGAKDIFGNTGTDNFYNFDNQTGGFTCPIISTTPTNVVYARNYTGGLILVKHRYDWSDSVVYGDESSSDTTKKDYALGGYFHPVNADGTLGAATNTVNLSNSEGAILLENRIPTINVPQNQTVPEDKKATFDITVNDPDGDSISFGATGLPAGATYLANGQNRATFSWTPSFDQAGTYPMIFTASDVSLTASKAITLTITDANRTPQLNALPTATIDEGQLLAQGLSATDADGDQLTFHASSLPTGATISDHADGTATLRWQPNYEQAGSYAVSVEVGDGKTTTSGTFTMKVNNATPPPEATNNINDAPSFAPISNQTGREGELLSFAVAATDPEGSRVTLQASNLPSGAVFTDYGDNTGTFRWEPSYSQAGTHKGINFRASDGQLESSLEITITVADSPIAGGIAPTRSFTAFPKPSLMMANLAVGNVTGDPRAEIVVGSGPGMSGEVRIFSNDGTLLRAFSPYGKKLSRGIRVAICDTTGDGKNEIVTVPGPGALPRIRVFDAQGKSLLGRGFLGTLSSHPYSSPYLACGDLDGDRKAEIVVGASPKTGSTVLVYSGQGRFLRKFAAYSLDFQNGINVAVADVTGDGRADILTVPANKSAHVQIFSGYGKRMHAGFLAFGKSRRDSTSITVGDVKGDHHPLLIIESVRRGQREVALFTQAAKSVGQFRLSPADSSAIISSGDIDGDGQDDIVTLRNGGGVIVEAFDDTGKPL